MLNQNKLHEYARSFYLDINPVGGSGIFFRTFIYSGTDFVNKVVMTKSGFQTHLFLFTFILSCLCYHTSCRNTKPHYSTISYDSLIAMEEELGFIAQSVDGGSSQGSKKISVLALAAFAPKVCTTIHRIQRAGYTPRATQNLKDFECTSNFKRPLSGEILWPHAV